MNVGQRFTSCLVYTMLISTSEPLVVAGAHDGPLHRLRVEDWGCIDIHLEVRSLGLAAGEDESREKAVESCERRRAD